MLRYKTSSTNGIEKCHGAELAPEFYKMNNRWHGIMNGKHVAIYAGALRHSPDKGVLVMRTLPSDSRRIGGRHCSIPQNSGALEIVEVRGNRLRVAMSNGGSFWLEIPATIRTAA